MSDNWLVVYPADPGWVPTSEQEDRAVDVIARLVPAATVGDRLELSRTAGIQFIDAGANFEAIRCPLCGCDLEMDWWHEQIDRQYSADDGFRLEPIVTACCGGTTALNALVYEWPQGFARWTATVTSPDRGRLTDAELGEIGAALEHPVRQTFRHI